MKSGTAALKWRATLRLHTYPQPSKPPSFSHHVAYLFATWSLVLVSFFLLPGIGVAPAHASSGYACFDQPCSEERKDYVDRWRRQVCAHASSLKTLLRRKERGQRVRADILARLNRCLARHPRRPGLCSDHARRLRNIDQSLADIQRRIDRLVARLRRSCNASLPNGVAGNPATCEEQEAGKYCPITDEQQALQSLQRRCADLEAEDAAQDAMCERCEVLNVGAAVVHEEDPDLSILASTKPTCVPVPTFTSTPTSTATPTATQTGQPVANTPTPSVTASPIASLTLVPDTNV